jgi:hypothetical protein
MNMVMNVEFYNRIAILGTAEMLLASHFGISSMNMASQLVD